MLRPQHSEGRYSTRWRGSVLVYLPLPLPVGRNSGAPTTQNYMLVRPPHSEGKYSARWRGSVGLPSPPSPCREKLRCTYNIELYLSMTPELYVSTTPTLRRKIFSMLAWICVGLPSPPPPWREKLRCTYKIV